MGLISSIINGILMGGIYGLLAMGLTLIFGIMKLINFAHGVFLMVSMISAYWFWRLTGLDPYIGIVIILPIMFMLGYITQLFVIQPVLDTEKDVREPVSVLMLTAAFAVAFENLVLMIAGADYVMAETAYSGKTIRISELLVSVPRLYAFLVTVIIAFLFFQFLSRTEIGRAIRATGQDRVTAMLMGINVKKIYGIAFGIGTVFAGVTGLAMIPFYYANPAVGHVFLTKTFVVVVLGGLGSIPGALVGGLIIGLIESVGAQFMTATLTAVLVYFGFLAFLLLKPSGLFGSKYEW
jgi:branched-chain amino acid transport system permease protein